VTGSAESPEVPVAAPVPEAAVSAEAAAVILQVKEGKVILRNLPFDIKEQHLKPFFSKYGSIVSINIPLNNTNNLNRGFAFLEYERKEDATKAIEGMNGQKFKGRTVALEFSLPKGKYEKKVQHILENTNQERQDVILPK
jgi:RNA recognition motif-containing protein